MADIKEAGKIELPSILKRLESEEWEEEDFAAAIRGEKVPHNLGFRLTQLCLIRGIRYHHGFAEELRGTGDEFTRALNARSIMSNIVPDIQRPEVIPYCIWFPDVPSQATCRELVKRYPQMVYQIGRVCAVAGYTDLYLELDILPEVHVAEEARECGSKAIYDAIMANAVKYSVMDDYALSIGEPKQGAFLNADTAVRTSLEVKQKFYIPETDTSDFNWLFLNKGYDDNIMFNITEDMNIDEYAGRGDPPPRDEPLAKDIASLLYTPLPMDLPSMDKDLLILMAAYHGDVDRYTRLHRPKLILNEEECILRGIYHNTLFAKWWSLQASETAELDTIQNAITARFIMNNDLSRVTKARHTTTTTPYIIYRPDLARNSTYEELSRRRPDMLPQILRACIVANYQDLFDTLYEKVSPDWALTLEAEASFNPHYLQVLNQRTAELGVDLQGTQKPGYTEWMGWTRKRNPHYKWPILHRTLSAKTVFYEYLDVPDGSGINVDGVDLYLSVPEEWKLDYWKANPAEWKDEKAVTEYHSMDLDYVEWPPAEMDPERVTVTEK